MGVQGLWDVLSKAGQSRSLAHIAVVDGFERNVSGRRAYRLGIDASIWYQHAMHSTKAGANPELRLLFFRLLRLAGLPFIPLFVFDGRERPTIKRGSKKGKSGSHALTTAFKKLLDAFGMEWRMALGEAEAELAYLNRVNVIDAVLTDDADTLIFGATTIIRNASLNLTGNRANPATDSMGKSSKHHVMTFSAETIRTHPEIQMSRGGLILFALISGGDYDHGLEHFGPQMAHSLARLGFGDQLLREYERCQGRDMGAFLSQWRADMNSEIHTNAHNLLRSRMPALSIPETFPDMDVLRCYVNPTCSASAGRQGGGYLRDNGEVSIPTIATFCEDHFDEWGHRSALLKRFRNRLWDPAVMRVLRRAALEADEKERTKRIGAGRNDTAIRGPLCPSVTEEVGTTAYLVKKYLSPTQVDRRAAAFVRRDNVPAQAVETLRDTNPLIRKVVGSRQHVSTDNILEYRVEMDPTQLVTLAESGIKGKHPEPPPGASNGSDDDNSDFAVSSSQDRRNTPAEPCSVQRIWLPASMMRQVHPKLVLEFEFAEEGKRARKAGGKRKGTEGAEASTESEGESECSRPATPAPAPRKRTRETVAPAIEDSAATANRDRDLPSASARGARRTRIDVDVQAESSLPLRKCGFIFTFPDPDSPDMLVTDEDENAGVLVDLDADEELPRMSQSTSQSVPSSHAGSSRAEPGPSMSQREPPRRPPAADSDESSEEDDYCSDVHDDGVRTWQYKMLDRLPLPKKKSANRPPVASCSTRGRGRSRGGGRARGKPPAPRRPRASAPAALTDSLDSDPVSAAFVNGIQAGPDLNDDDDLDDETNSWMDRILTGGGKRKAPARARGRARGTRGRTASAARASRRQTMHNADFGLAASNRDVTPPNRTTRRSSPPPPARWSTPPPRDVQPGPVLSLLGRRADASGSRALDKSPEPLFLPSPSPPPPSRGRKRARSFNANDVIEIESSEDERPSLSALKRRPRYYPAAEPSSSQPSRLSDSDFLHSADVVIDLT